MVSVLARQKIETEYEIIDSCWNAIGLPDHMPTNIFIKYMEYLLDPNTKLGDRMTNSRRIEGFNKTLENFVFEPTDCNRKDS